MIIIILNESLSMQRGTAAVMDAGKEDALVGTRIVWEINFSRVRLAGWLQAISTGRSVQEKRRVPNF